MSVTVVLTNDAARDLEDIHACVVAQMVATGLITLESADLSASVYWPGPIEGLPSHPAILFRRSRSASLRHSA